MKSRSTEASLGRLSNSLSKELRSHTNGEHLKSISIFNKFSAELRAAVVEIMEERIF